MSEAEFRQRRRQKFLTEKYFELNQEDIRQTMRAIAEGKRVHEEQGRVSSSNEGSAFKESMRMLRLHYTAGEPIESLKPLYADALHWFDQWHRAEHEYSVYLAKKRNEDLRLDMTPIEFGDLFHFQLAIDVVSLGLLLGEPDSVRQAAQWMHSARHSDMLFETLIESVVPDPDTSVSEFFHKAPYDPLLDAIYTADTPEESAAYVKKYLDGWYKAFEGVPWHNGHLVQTEEYSNYEGYWAFEAAAVCVLKGIDDSSFRDHLVYPKDLADWARAHKVTEAIRWRGAAPTEAPLRCEAGQPCPRDGWWHTPAGSGRRQRFAQGDVMPHVGGAYGATIWQWDEQQDE